MKPPVLHPSFARSPTAMAAYRQFKSQIIETGHEYTQPPNGSEVRRAWASLLRRLAYDFIREAERLEQ